MSSGKGGAVFAHNYRKIGKIFIELSRFDRCEASAGGAVYGSNIQMDVVRAVFLDNRALDDGDEFSGQGGALFFESKLDNGSVYLEESEFIGNKAEISGGGIQWYNFQPDVINSTFNLNSAPYGPDIASFACILKYYNEVKQITLVPGANSSEYINLYSLDHYGQVVTTENSSVILVTLLNTSSSSSLSGNIRFKVSQGLFKISQLIIRSKPDSFINISFSCQFKYNNQVDDSSEIVQVYLRDCIKGETLKGGDACIKCSPGTYNMKASTSCLPCPDGGICLGGSDLLSAEGYWRKSKASDIFYKCFLPAACLEESYEDHDFEDKCEKGYTGNLCQGCIRGYSRDGENKCAECGDETNNIVFVCLVSTGGAVVIFILTASTISAAYKEQSITSVYFKIMTNYTQIVALTISFDLDWPDMVLKLFDGQKQAVGASDRLFSIDCLLKEGIEPFYARLLLINLVPILFSILSTFFWLIKSSISKTPDLFSKIIGSITVQVFFFMASIIKINFSMFNCMHLGNSDYYLITDMTIKCWEGDHLNYLFSIVIPGITFWCFLIPLIIIYLLYNNKSKLKETKELLKFGFLHKGYQTNYFYWEFIILFRKIAIISCSVFLQNVSIHIQALTTFVVILVAFSIHIKSSPYMSIS